MHAVVLMINTSMWSMVRSYGVLSTGSCEMTIDWRLSFKKKKVLLAEHSENFHSSFITIVLFTGFLCNLKVKRM